MSRSRAKPYRANGRSAESADAASADAADAKCISQPDGSCIGTGCMHDMPEPRPMHPCSRCGKPIDNRYAFGDCTTCAVATNNEAMIPWRDTQREIARQRIAEMKMRLHENRLEG